MQQIHHEGLKPLALLHRGGDALGERRAGVFAACRAMADMGAMFGDRQGPRFWQVEHLPSGKAFARRFRQSPIAAGARLGEMVDGRIGVLDLLQGFAGVAALPAGLSARRTVCPRGHAGFAFGAACSAHRWPEVCRCCCCSDPDCRAAPRRRSSAAMRTACETTNSCSSVLRAISAAMMAAAAAAVPGGLGSAERESESEGRDMGSLTNDPTRVSSGRSKTPTWAVTIRRNKAVGGLAPLTASHRIGL